MSFCLGTVGITKEKGTNRTHGCRVLVATTGIENGTGIDGLKIKLGNSMYLSYLTSMFLTIHPLLDNIVKSRLSAESGDTRTADDRFYR